MAIAIAQSQWVISTASVSSISVQLTSVGNPSLLVAGVQDWDYLAFEHAAGDIDDDVSASAYSLDIFANNVTEDGPGGLGGAFYSRQNTTTGTINVTYNPTDATSVWCNLIVYELTGAVSSGAYDNGDSKTGTSKSPTTDQFSLSVAGAIFGLAHTYCSAAVVWSAGVDYVISDDGATAGGANNESCDYTPGVAFHRLGCSSGNYTPNCTYTSTATDSWLCLAAAYKSAITDSIELEGFRFRNDDGSEATATWKANQDTNITLAADTAFRLREILNATGDPASMGAQAEYRYKPSGGAFGSFIKINLLG